MDFDFLPKLPKSDLDDRKFKDLVEECLQRIPRYCPEWTNYNPSDPGITLIELFAWLTDQMLLRFNQVPRRNYVAFLELLGIRLQAPAPAKTDLTFYLTTALPDSYCIPAATEVATVRTETEEAVVFSTDAPLTIGKPRIRHFLTAETAETVPQVLRDRFTNLWTQRSNGQWEGREQSIFNDQPQPGNCFYLVFEPDQPIEGNVIAITIKGEEATSTGINPDAPPRRWEAWNGAYWQSVLLQEADDGTRGFSFSELAQQGNNPLQGADVILHMPNRWPVEQFTAYQGRWLRCMFATPYYTQSSYSSSPRILGFGARAIGGTVGATQSITIRDEVLEVSDGTPGQTFQLQGIPILERREDEYILVTPPGGMPQRWREVKDFADSGPEDLHYTIDSLEGTVQFGPLVREPGQIKHQTQWRRRYEMGNSGLSVGQFSGVEAGNLNTLNSSALAPAGRDGRSRVSSDYDDNDMSRQYGAVPPRGSLIRMVAYRTGGGIRGNVARGAISVPKTAVPYVSRVVNYEPARNGSDAESLEDAAIRVPKTLRTRDRAVTKEDFEALTLQAGAGAVARALCLPALSGGEAGAVRLLIVPDANTDAIVRGEGINPEQFALSPQLQAQIMAYLDERRLLGVPVRLHEPEYTGVAVQTEVALDPEYNNPRAQQEILFKLRVALYRFLNPLTGGPQRQGWPFGRPVYPSDIVTLFQQTPGVRYLGVVQLFELRKDDQGWVRTLPQDPVIDPGPLGLICSWAGNRRPASAHVVNLIQ